MNYLFWNIKGEKVNRIIETIIINYECDIIAFAEYKDDMNVLLKSLSEKGYLFYHVPKMGCERIDIITKFTPSKIETYNETSYFTIKKIPHNSIGFQLIAFVHFPSKLYMGVEGSLEHSRELIASIEESETASSFNNTIIVGDFNMNPFEVGMVSATGIHSIPNKIISSNINRKIKGKTYSMFYNPMWNFFGDNKLIPGTYFYDNSDYVNYYWHIFDQVIIRPTLIKHFCDKSIKIISTIEDINLLSNGRPKKEISDHLPIFFKII